MMEVVNISYFRKLLSKQMDEFKTSIENWEGISSSENIPEDVRDEIRTTIGLTNLLMRQKMKQFGELIDDSENNTGEKEITCVDLQGFWDMVFHEVEKLQKNFLKLEKCQKNNWVFVEEPVAKVESKKQKEPAAINPKIENAAKERAAAARQRLAEAKLKMKSKLVKKNEDVVEVLISKPDKEVKEETRGKEQLNKSDESPRKRSKRMESKSELPEKVTPNKDSQNGEVSAKSDLKLSSKKKNKENILLVTKKETSKSTHTPNEKVSTTRGKKNSKEIVPLQCLTRSAKKALLAKENAL